MVRLIILYVIGIVFILVALYLRYWRNKRKFYRRNAVGVEEFNSYDKSVLINLVENFAKFIYYFLFIVGVLILLLTYFGAPDIMRVRLR